MRAFAAFGSIGYTANKIVTDGIGDVDVYNSVGSIDVVIDVQGWFAP